MTHGKGCFIAFRQELRLPHESIAPKCLYVKIFKILNPEIDLERVVNSRVLIINKAAIRYFYGFITLQF